MANVEKAGDLILAPSEFAFTQDGTKGDVITHTGPLNFTLGGNDMPIVYDHEGKKFVQVSMADMKQRFTIAPAGWYVVLLNPAGDKHPKIGGKSQNTPDDIVIGKKVVVPGPCSFALWPGQTAEVIQGHRLRSNQYLFIEIYDDEAAKNNWTQATFKQAAGEAGQKTEGTKEATGEAGEKEGRKEACQKRKDGRRRCPGRTGGLAPHARPCRDL